MSDEHQNLMPCPWCGAVPRIMQLVVPGKWYVQCMNHKCPVYWQTSGVSEAEAISKANNRTNNNQDR